MANPRIGDLSAEKETLSGWLYWTADEAITFREYGSPEYRMFINAIFGGA